MLYIFLYICFTDEKKYYKKNLEKKSSLWHSVVWNLLCENLVQINSTLNVIVSLALCLSFLKVLVLIKIIKNNNKQENYKKNSKPQFRKINMNLE